MTSSVKAGFTLSATAEFSVLESVPNHFRSPKPNFVLSAHGDTCFGESSCIHVPGSNGYLYYGHIDNAGGVHALMQAYFSGNLPTHQVQCKVTYGEEKAINGVFFAGARDVMENLSPHDFVAVIDVTGSCSRGVNESTVQHASTLIGHVVIEKVRNNSKVLALLDQLRGKRTHVSGIPVEGSQLGTTDDENVPYTYEIYNFCNDEHAYMDETEAYSETQDNTVFLGLQTSGGSYAGLESNGDYNDGPVFCWKRDIDALSLLIVDLANAFISPAYQHKYLSK